MEEIKALLISLGGAIALTSLFKILLSDSSLKKVLNIFFSSLILFYIFIPISSIAKTDFEVNDYVANDEQAIQNGMELVVVKSVEEVCSKSEVNVINIEIDAYIENDQLNVNELIVYIEEKDRVIEVQNEIKKNLDYEVLVQWVL